jgi:peptidoglycan hydrolase-like protein with peptidoglycan-binding domain
MSNSSTGAGASHSDVTQAQTALKEKGLYSGPIDGRIGPKTRQAISQFQRQNGLKQTAQLDSRTMSELQGGGGTSGSGATEPSNSSPSAPSGSPAGSGAGGMPPAGGTGGMH